MLVVKQKFKRNIYYAKVKDFDKKLDIL